LPSYRERALTKVLCPVCGKSMNQQYLPVHMRQFHRRSLPHLQPEVQPSCFIIPFPKTAESVPCPISDCAIPIADRTRMYRHFCIRHSEHTIIIIGDKPRVRCTSCGMYVLKVTPAHLRSQFCQRQTERKLRKALNMTYQRAATSTSFRIGDQPIEQVSEYRYLGRMLAEDDCDDLAVSFNLAKARSRWGRMVRVLSAENATPKVMARFYLTIVQAVLLYGSETWVLSPHDLQRLESFHRRCARHLAHMPIRRKSDGTWIHPATTEVLERCHLSPIKTYIAKRKTTLLNNYARDHSPLYRECRQRATVYPPSRAQLFWWNSEPQVDL